MPGTQYFSQKQKSSLNSFIGQDGAKDWQPDSKYLKEADDVVLRAQYELTEGILTKYTALRMKQLDEVTLDKCYKNPKFSMMEAEACEDFHHKNDYKLRNISNFWQDHIPKHLKSYDKCSVVQNMATVADKDKAFADCHTEWVSNFRINTTQELELRARQLFGKTLEPKTD